MIKQNLPGVKTPSKQIVQFDSNGNMLKIYISINDLCRTSGVERRSVQHSINKYIKAKGHYYCVNDKTEIEKIQNKISKINGNRRAGLPPRILVLDVETAPLTAYIWGCNKQYVNPDNIITDSFLLSWAGKWLYDTKIHSDFLTGKEAIKCNDKRITKSIYNIINQADIVIAHNGLAFDKKVLNTRFLVNGLDPTLPYQMIDTCRIARDQFFFPSNKLDYINYTLGLETKIETGGFKLWKDCKCGDDEALKKMNKYNINDILILEENYFRIRKFIKNHPNVGLYTDEITPVCANCGSMHIKWQTGKNAKYFTPMNSYPIYRCECGFVGRSPHSDLSKKKRNVLNQTTAR